MAVKKKSPDKPDVLRISETVEAVEPEAAPAAAPPAYLVYIGPSIRGNISANAIITQGGLALLRDTLDKYPDIKTLLMPGDKLAEARAELKQPGSYLRAVYTRLAAKA